MDVTLSIIAVVVLSVLLVVSTQRWRAERAAKSEAVALAHTGMGDQRDRSERMRAEVRAAHAERTRKDASDEDVQRAEAGPDR